NRTGAGGQLALSHVKDAPADGSVLLLVPSSHVAVYPHTYRKLPYHPVEDFAPVSLVAHANMAFGVGPMVPASVKTLADYLAWAKANPAQASYGSPAPGSIAHLLAAYVGSTSGVPLTHIPYRGSTAALQDLRGGTLPAHSGPAGVFLPLLGTGQIRLLCVSGEARSRFLPNVPT
ncbi:MAG: twin-arginine translocation pathway signal protein, partial [Burkholderiales bacterium PBB5]